MAKARPSKEYADFDAMMGDLLTVPKSELNERLEAHKVRAATNPNKRGPKPKVTPQADAPAVAEDTEP